MRHFKQVFSEVIDFEVIDAPFECPAEPPRELQRFLAEDRTHFRSWLKFSEWNQEVGLSPDVVYGLEEVVDYLVGVLRTQGQFDGVLAFSQGGIIFRHFYRITQEIEPEAFARPDNQTKQVFQMPRFLMSCSSPVFDMRFRYKGELYTQRRTQQFNFPSLHMHGTQDEFKKNLVSHTLFTEDSNPQVIEFEAGHRFPRELSKDGFLKLKNFVREQFIAKNGNDDEFECEYNDYNFQVRIAK